MNSQSIVGSESAFDILLGAAGRATASIRSAGALAVVTTLLGMGLGVAVALLWPPQYTSSASFIAQGTSPTLIPGALQSLAATVGLGSAKDFSSQFYADLLSSRPVLLNTIEKQYRIQEEPTTHTYIEIEGFAKPDSNRAREAALQDLQRHVSARADVRTNVISVSVRARSAQLSHALLVSLIGALDSINIGFRQEQSRELRQFFEGRVADARAGLDSAEEDLRRFLERNRIIQGSPALQFEQERLQRGVDLKRAVYSTVVQQHEEARLQEARNVPILTILSPPSLPVKRSSPPRRFIVALFTLFGLFAVPLLSASRHTWRRFVNASTPRST